MQSHAEGAWPTCTAAKLGAELVTAISAPLGACVRGFPEAARLHPFERALLDLTFGPDIYQRRLARLTTLRQSAVEVTPLFDTLVLHPKPACGRRQALVCRSVFLCMRSIL
jgi:GTP1/Obg family GTP-binding protein